MIVTNQWVWSVGSKPVGWKWKNDRAKILPHKAENRKAKNTSRPKKFISLNSLLLFFVYSPILTANKGYEKKIRPYRNFGLLVFGSVIIFRPYDKNIISAYWFRSYSTARFQPVTAVSKCLSKWVVFSIFCFSQDKRVNQCLLEIQHLKSRLVEMERDTNSLRDRVETEKSLNREILTENTKLKTELKNAAEEKDKSQRQVQWGSK